MQIQLSFLLTSFFFWKNHTSSPIGSSSSTRSPKKKHQVRSRAFSPFDTALYGVLSLSDVSASASRSGNAATTARAAQKHPATVVCLLSRSFHRGVSVFFFVLFPTHPRPRSFFSVLFFYSGTILIIYSCVVARFALNITKDER